MKIAMTSPNGKALAGHAGKCPGYLIYQVENGEVVHKERVKLTKEQVFSQFSGALSENTGHPLYGIDVFITQSAGGGLQNRLARDGIQVILTEENDPDAIVATLLA